MSEVKYKKEIDEIFDSMCEDWMNENDKKEFKESILKEWDYEFLNKAIEDGVQMGISVEAQVILCKLTIKQYLKKEKKND